MRIKIDFVTNSSSSSFLVAWPNKIKTLDDVLKFIRIQERASIVYHDAIEQEPIHLQEGNFDYDFDQATKIITEKLADFFTNGYTETVQCYHLHDEIRRRIQREMFKNINNISPKDWEKLEDETNKEFISKYGMSQQELQHQKAVLLAESFIKGNKGKWLYMFHYGDEDGSLYSALEHDGTFDGLVSIQVSHH
jgi:hypothetical protein